MPMPLSLANLSLALTLPMLLPLPLSLPLAKLALMLTSYSFENQDLLRRFSNFFEDVEALVDDDVHTTNGAATSS
jgi:hypothetical protein